jgi:hypothetical protein
MIVTSDGWLYSLADDSNWGTISGFYESIWGFPQIDGEIIVSSDVWGQLKNMHRVPVAGEGFAFYHSWRAGYPKADPFGKRPRISAMGRLLDISLDGRNVDWIEVAIDPAVLDALQQRPIIRDETNRALFEESGIVRVLLLPCTARPRPLGNASPRLL